MNREVLILTLFIFSFSLPLYGLERSWTNVVGNNLWSEPLNWIPIGVPQSEDSVLTSYADNLIIPFGHNASIKYIRHLGDLTIETGAELIITDGHFNCNGELINRGKISIFNSPTYGLRQSSLQMNSQPITNEGSIYIDNSALAGLWIRSDQTFTNEESGFVQITNSGGASVELLGTFSNRGVIRAQSSIAEVALLMVDEMSSFTNLKCAKVRFEDKITINDGLFSNFGFLRQNYNGINETYAPNFDDYFVNYGVIEDLQSSFLSDFENFGIWVTVYDDEVLEGESTYIFESLMPLDVAMSDIYLENDLLTSAGTYDYANNVWVPNGNAVGASSFFVEVSQDGGGCLDTVKFNVDEAVEGVNFWKGGTGSWQFGINWNYGTVPTASDRVAIYGSADVVTIPISYQAFAKDLLLNGELRVSPLSTLSIESPSNDDAMELFLGRLINNGSIQLKEAKVGANVNGSIIENNGVINCMTTSTCIDISAEGSLKSEFINNENASVTSDTARLLSSFNSVARNYGILESKIKSFSTSMSGDSLYNYGTINIKGESIDEGKGILIDFVNIASGDINVSKLLHGINSNGVNHGQINIDTCSTGLLVSGGNFINEGGGSVEIRQCKEAMDAGLRDITNNPGGQVRIIKNELGIMIPSAGSVRNNGFMQIDSTLTNGITCYGDLYNELSARINIDRGVENGLLIDASTAKVYCRDQSKIEISNFIGQGLLIERGELLLEDNALVRIRPPE